LDNKAEVCYQAVMNVTTEPTQAPTLQAARRAFARAHICNAARELFYEQGYVATTFDQIAKAAGTRRTTLYSHFRDKADILEQIADEYQTGLCALVVMLDGPVPTRAQIDGWITAMVEFVAEQRAPATLVIGLGVGQDTPDAIQRTSERFPRALGERLSAFGKTMDASPGNGSARAWAKVVLRELSLGCLQAARQDTDSAESLAVAADLFDWFVHEFA
jgi:AcrR family transcriptional regulator